MLKPKYLFLLGFLVGFTHISFKPELFGTLLTISSIVAYLYLTTQEETLRRNDLKKEYEQFKVELLKEMKEVKSDQYGMKEKVSELNSKLTLIKTR